MSNIDRYGPLGLPDAFFAFCKAQKSCAKCPVAKAKAAAFRLKTEGQAYQPCIGAFADMEEGE